jgi:hypothetical protein
MGNVTVIYTHLIVVTGLMNVAQMGSDEKGMPSEGLEASSLKEQGLAEPTRLMRGRQINYTA